MEHQEKRETPTAGWRENVDGDGQTRDAGNDGGKGERREWTSWTQKQTCWEWWRVV